MSTPWVPSRRSRRSGHSAGAVNESRSVFDGAHGRLAAPSLAPKRPPALAEQDSVYWPEIAERPHLGEFVSWLWSSETMPTPLYAAWGRGAMRTGSGPGASRMPYGRILVYRDWLVFLTEGDGRQPQAGLRDRRRFRSWLRLVMGSDERLTKHQRERFRRALGSRDTIIVPRRTVRGGRQQGRLFQRLTGHVEDRRLVFRTWRRRLQAFLGPAVNR